MPTPIELIQAVYAAYDRKDVPALLGLVAPDVEVFQTEALPWGGHHREKTGLLRFLSLLAQCIESRVETSEIFEAGDRVVQVGRTRGCVRETGVPFDVREVHVWRVRDGMVVGFEAFIDTPAMLAALAA